MTTVLTFRAGGARWGIPLERVREAARMRQFSPLPGAPAHYRGVSTVRGEPVGVLEVGALLEGTVPHAPGGEMLIVLEGHPHALVVDAIDGIEEIPAERQLPAPPGVRRLVAVVAEERGFLSILDVDALVSATTP